MSETVTLDLGKLFDEERLAYMVEQAIKDRVDNMVHAKVDKAVFEAVNERMKKRLDQQFDRAWTEIRERVDSWGYGHGTKESFGQYVEREVSKAVNDRVVDRNGTRGNTWLQEQVHKAAKEELNKRIAEVVAEARRAVDDKLMEAVKDALKKVACG